MSSNRLVIVFLFFVIYISSSQNVTTPAVITTSSPKSSYYTTEPLLTCSSNYGLVYVENPPHLQGTILSSRVNFEPYYYEYPIKHASICIFPANVNPCNLSNLSNYTITSIYHKIVLIYSKHEYFDVCNPQQWTLNMQQLNALAVLIINPNDMNNVYMLSGTDSIDQQITIPTRMITQLSGYLLINTSNTTQITISIKCDNTMQYPEIICIEDTSITGEYYFLDGQYQKQTATFNINQHPVWIKQQLLNVIDEYYIFLYIDNEVNGWYWLISNTYTVSFDNNKRNIYAYCNQSVNDPSLCETWFTFNSSQSYVLNAEFDSANTFCEASDRYLCVSSDNNAMANYIGTYHQIHNGVALWEREGAVTGKQSIINKNNIWLHDGQYMAHSIMDIKDRRLIAFCTIYKHNGHISDDNDNELILSPWLCDDKWYIFDLDTTEATVDHTFFIEYSSCFVDYFNFCLYAIRKYSHYQYLYGVYKVNKNEIINGHYTFINQRIDIVIYWNKTLSLWTINNNNNKIAVCDNEYAQLPQDCQCWMFDDKNEIICDINIEGNDAHVCVDQHVQNDTNAKTLKDLCVVYLNESMVLKKEFDGDIGERYYWSYKNIENNEMYYIKYNEYYRFWVFGNIEINDNMDSNIYILYCMEYDTLYPINCTNWYYNNGIMVVQNDVFVVDECVQNLSKGMDKKVILLFILSVIGLIALIICSFVCYYKGMQIWRRKQALAILNLTTTSNDEHDDHDNSSISGYNNNININIELAHNTMDNNHSDRPITPAPASPNTSYWD